MREEKIMADISRHPLLKQAYEVCLAIEKCGASEELTEATIKASDLMDSIDRLVTVSECDTADAWMSLSDEQKREWFATTLRRDTWASGEINRLEVISQAAERLSARLKDDSVPEPAKAAYAELVSTLVHDEQETP